MAMDSWAPHRFANLSNRLVRLNGVFLMGTMALLVLWLTRGRVSMLVVLYAINVFLTFSLSQLSMCVHWWQDRRQDKGWWKHFAINGLGLVLTSAVLVITTVIKFRHGGWVTLLLTGGFIGACILTRRHYDSVRRALKRLDEMLVDLPFPENVPRSIPPQPEGPTAVLMVEGYNGLGIHSIFSIRKLFKGHEFKNLIFISVGLIDSSKFKGIKEIENLRQATEDSLKRYVDLAHRMGYASEYRLSLGTDVTTEITKLCERISTDFVEPVFFAGKLIFAEENLFTRLLHNQTSLELQRRLLFEGYNMVVMPIRVL
jgi:K+ transporter